MFRLQCAICLVLLFQAMSCASFEDHIRNGDYATACEAARGDPVLQQKFDVWYDRGSSVAIELVPQDQVEKALGGPISGYGEELGLYQLSATTPGGEWGANLTAAPEKPHRLVRLMQPLVMDAKPLLPPGPYVLDDFAPDPLPRKKRRSRGFFESIIGAAVDIGVGMGKAIGGAVGAMVAVPIAVTTGIMQGSVEIVHGIFGSSGGGYSSGGYSSGGHGDGYGTGARLDFEVPIYSVTATRGDSKLDGLLDRNEYQALKKVREKLWQEQRQRVQQEQKRRLQLMTDIRDVLDICGNKKVPCRHVLKPGSSIHVKGWSGFSGPDTYCLGPSFKRTLQVPGQKSSRPPWPKPVPPATVNLMDQTAPFWALRTAVTTDVEFNDSTAAMEAQSILCHVQLKKRVKPSSTFHLRLAVGKEVPRVQRWLLSGHKKQLRFMAPEVQLLPGERVRISLLDKKSRRSLGGGLAEMTGVLPLIIENRAFKAKCTVPEAIAIDRSYQEHKTQAQTAMENLGRALVEDNAEEAAKNRQAARGEIMAVAMLLGWQDPKTTQLLSRLIRLDPAEDSSVNSAEGDPRVSSQ